MEREAPGQCGGLELVHSHADTAADVEVAESHGVLHVRVRDDGRGGADVSHGSGLVGLKDRAEALGGTLRLRSPPGEGTTLEIALPLHDAGGPELPSGAEGPPDNANRGLAAEWRGMTTLTRKSPER
ncbi:MAG TPA: ATP-binding protein [Streptosporangiaceae bacterium]|nr:ATP-binding protein [Streptosporangiaceae bacterium]